MVEPLYQLEKDGKLSADDACGRLGPEPEDCDGGQVPVWFSRDSQSLLSVTTNRTLRWWNLTNGYLSFEVRLPEAGVIRAESISPDGRALAVGMPKDSIRTYDTETGTALRELPGESSRWRAFAAWSPNSRSWRSVCPPSAWRFTNGPRSDKVAVLEAASRTMAFSPDGKVLATGG